MAEGEVAESTDGFVGQFVELHGLDSQVEVQVGPPSLQGQRVDANGKRGLAQELADGAYSVQTFDGLVLNIPEANLKLLERRAPEDGGFDLPWSPQQQRNDPQATAFKVAECLAEKGHCVLQMFEPDEVRDCVKQVIDDRNDFVMLPPEFKEFFLGQAPDSKIVWLKTSSTVPEEFALDPLAYYSYHLKYVSHVLSDLPSEILGFLPAMTCSDTLLRIPLSGSRERQVLDPGPLTDEDIEKGNVEAFLDFTQRRKLCMLYMVDGEGGEIELRPGGDPDSEAWHLPITRDRILIFRHDMLSYTYRPKSERDVVFQTWLCEEAHQLWLEKFRGSETAVEKLCVENIPKVPPSKQVHMMNCLVKYPGCAYGAAKAWCVWGFETDCFVKVPTVRYDMDLYYTSDPEVMGKSFSQHTGFVGDDWLISFDNEFFGISHDLATMLPPTQRMALEVSFENFAMNGYTRKSLRGAQCSIYTAECQGSLDWDHFQGKPYDPRDKEGHDTWLQAGVGCGISTCTRLAHSFGVNGQTVQIDTACSSSLVCTNTAYAMLRKAKADNLDVLEAQANASKACLLPFAYMGLSAAGMVGKGGRCFTFDVGANGFTRGEGGAAVFMRVSDDPQMTYDRMGCMMNGYINQDGRSASLTAPNGPSQSLCIRSCMRDAQLLPEDTAMMECHGTGTALGDPIEVGSTRATFQRRPYPLGITSAKSHFGHLEDGAGLVNVLKTLISLTHAAVPPNCHCKCLNPHIEDKGFPCMFPDQAVDCGVDTVVGGLNSFGFGGTNAHAEMWARCRFGDKASGGKRLKIESLDWVSVACPSCGRDMCWLCGLAVPRDVEAGKHHCSAIRDEFSHYDVCSECYCRERGAYKARAPELDVVSKLEEVLVRHYDDDGNPLDLEIEGAANATQPDPSITPAPADNSAGLPWTTSQTGAPENLTDERQFQPSPQPGPYLDA